MSENTSQVAVVKEAQTGVLVKASAQLSQFLGIEPKAMMEAIKAQCFKCEAGKITDSQLAAFISVANEMKVNPLLPGMLYAYPNQGGIVPIMGPDGVFKKLTEHPDVDSWETKVYPEDINLPPTHAETKVWRKGRERPLAYTAILTEWKVGSNPNWNTRPRHMLGLRSLKQAARQVIHGLPYDEDDRQMMRVGAIDIGGSLPTARQDPINPFVAPVELPAANPDDSKTEAKTE